LSIRTQERDLDEEFSRFGRVEKVTIVYDQRVRGTLRGTVRVSLIAQSQSDRSRGFGFIKMATVEDAARCITELNGVVGLVLFSSKYTLMTALIPRI
jgi:transformer-2 protein